MNENINLCEILKDCPKGTKFYSPLHGELFFIRILHDTKGIFPIEFLDRENKRKKYMSDGRYDYTHKECLLFPSKDQRDWDKFTASWLKNSKFDPKTLKAFDRVLVRDKCTSWLCGLFTCIGSSNQVMANGRWDYVVPYNEETKHLVGTSDEAPEFYRYWED